MAKRIRLLRRNRRIVSFLNLLLVVILFRPIDVAHADRRPMTVDDNLNVVQLGTVLMSPDGKWVFYEQKKLDWDKNKLKSTFYMVSADGGKPYQYIGEAGGSAFQFSPRGTYLAFKRKVNDENQIFTMRTSGGEAVQLTKHDTSVGNFKWTDDERSIVFSAPKPRTKEEKQERKKGQDAIFVDEGPNGQKEGRWKNLWKIDLGQEKADRLTQGDQIISTFDASPDGRRIVYLSRNENRRNQVNLVELYLLDLGDSSVTRLTENKARESTPKWSPDGKHVAFVATDDREFELRHRKIWQINIDSKEVRLVSGAFAGIPRGYVWTLDGKKILFTGEERTSSNLYRLNVGTEKLSQVTDRKGMLRVRSYSRDRARMVYSYSEFDTPDDLYVSPTKRLEPIRITDLNPFVRDSLAFSKPRLISWESGDGMHIEGFLLLPVNQHLGEPFPLLLHIHGGPAGHFRNSWHYPPSANGSLGGLAQIYAGLGYTQLFPNVRGSSAYSDEFLRANMRDIGGGDYHDLMSGVDHLISEGYVDSTRMGIRGWSYGGILGGWTITQTNRFNAASLGAMVSDWTSEYGGYSYDVRLWYIGGTPWENPEGWRGRSPLTHTRNVTTATILFHGINDAIDSEPQSMNFYAFLKDQGKTVRYIRFPREPHDFTEPRHQQLRDVEEIRWMQKYVKGIEWKPRKKPKPKKEKDDEERKD